MTLRAQVEPQFSHASTRTEAELAELLEMEIEVELSSTAGWVVAPDSMVLLSSKDCGQTFPLRLDPSQLPPVRRRHSNQELMAAHPN